MFQNSLVCQYLLTAIFTFVIVVRNVFQCVLTWQLYLFISDCYLKCLQMCSGMAALVFRSASPRLLLLCLAPWRPCDVTPRATIAVQPTLPKLWPKPPFLTLLGGFFLLKDFFWAKTLVSSEKRKGRKCRPRKSSEVQDSFSKLHLKSWPFKAIKWFFWCVCEHC